jgi:hypothetical protein
MPIRKIVSLARSAMVWVFLSASSACCAALVDDLEITQSVQDLSQSADLIAGKQTYARAYVNWPNQNGAMVSGTLEITDLSNGLVT